MAAVFSAAVSGLRRMGVISAQIADMLSFGIIGGAIKSASDRRATRKARDAYNASLKDRLVSAPTVDAFRSRCYGRVRNVDGVLFKATRGDKSQFYTLVIALAGHECDGIETVYFNDQAVELDGDGYVLTAPWSGTTVASGTRTFNGQAVITLTAGAGTVTLDNTPIPGTVSVSVDDANAVTVAAEGNVVSVSGLGVSGSAVVNYQFLRSASADTAKARVRKYLGAPGQDLSTVLAPLFPGLIVAGRHRFAGICCLLVDLEFDQDAYATGLPQISAVFRGARVRDRRTGATAWTQNTALIADDWARYAQGGGALESELVASTFSTAANVCDVPHLFNSVNADGVAVATTRPMYTCNIVCRTDASPSDTLSSIVETMAGAWAWTGGQLRVRAGAYSAPVATLTESWCGGQGDIDLVPAAARSELVNVYQATIADATQAYVAVPVPRVAAAAYIEADGGELPRELTLEGVTDADHAQHICGVLLRDQRQGLTGRIPCNLSAYPLEVFDVIALDLPRFGFSGKTVEVTGWRFSQAGGVVLEFKETDASIYDPDAAFTRSDPAPNTALPNPLNVPPVLLNAPVSGTAELLRQADGTIVSRMLVSWPAVQDAGVVNSGAIEVRYGLASRSPLVWQTITVPGADTQVYIDGVQDGAVYLIQARARNRLVAGDWSGQKLHLVLGKLAPPAAVQGLAATVVPGALRITRTPSTEPDYDYTLYRYGVNWLTAAPVPGTSDERGCLWPWPSAGQYVLWAADVDSSKNVGTPTFCGPVEVTTAALSPASAALSIKLNSLDIYGTPSNSNAYLHAIDGDNNAIDAPGSILINGVRTPVPNERLTFSVGSVASYLMWASDGALFTMASGWVRFFVLARLHEGQWQYDNGAGWVNFTPTVAMYVIGTVQTGSLGSEPGIVAASLLAAAQTPSSIIAGPQGLQGPQGPQGLPGPQGPQGSQGIAGSAGSNGQTSYFHVAYANSADGTVGFNQSAGAYVGTYVDFSPADSSSPSAYAWRQFVGAQGSQGNQGIPGTNGANGQTSYLHIKYSNDGGATFTGSGGEEVGAFIGTYVDFTAADSTSPGAYQWAQLTGPQGPQGPQGTAGPAGINGQTSYFHVAYANSADGTVGFNQSAGAYVGTYVDFSPTDSSSPSAYTWRQFVGAQGSQGNQGIPGTNGANGQTSYLHIKYSNDGGATFTGSGGEEVGAFIGTYVDFTAADSASPAAYQWARLQAPDYEQEAAPIGAPQGSTWRVPSTGRTYKLLGSTWQPYVGAGSVNTNELANAAVHTIAVFTGTGIGYSGSIG